MQGYLRKKMKLVKNILCNLYQRINNLITQGLLNTVKSYKVINWI